MLGLVLLAAELAHAANGCSATFSDRRAQRLLVIDAQQCSVLDYSPRCAKVAAGTTVEFRIGSCHPTFPGLVTGEMATIDQASPIGTMLSAGTYTFELNVAGEFPYFCDAHFRMGMAGSILVVPETFLEGFE